MATNKRDQLNQQKAGREYKDNFLRVGEKTHSFFLEDSFLETPNYLTTSICSGVVNGASNQETSHPAVSQPMKREIRQNTIFPKELLLFLATHFSTTRSFTLLSLYMIRYGDTHNYDRVCETNRQYSKSSIILPYTFLVALLWFHCSTHPTISVCSNQIT